MKITFSIEYNTRWGETISLRLGGRKYPMNWEDGGLWSITLEAGPDDLKDYGYLLMRDGLIGRVEWTSHSADVPAGRKSMKIHDRWIDCPFPGSPFIRSHQVPDFDKPGFKAAGLAVPVFSLRTAGDFGIGELSDLIPLTDWAASVGLKIIQLLPVTDTTRHGGWEDSYPYGPASSFALHPLYVNLSKLGVRFTPRVKKLQDDLNALAEIDYPRVFKEKMALIRKAYEEHGADDCALDAFRKFDGENGPIWLEEYAGFCAERDGDSPLFWKWIQYHLDLQFTEAVKHARRKGVHFKGDLPIGVSADSADARFHPEFFNLDSYAGAPPDFFSTEGQCWGFPTYNWDEMARDDYAWWKARLRHMSKYFDAFRIDHILGFFRIWEIPADSGRGSLGHFNPALPYTEDEIEAMYLPLEGLFLPDPRNKGCWQPRISPDTSGLEWWQKERFDALYDDFFYHRNDSFWRRNAMKKLPELLSATGMLACGEDLGMVPECVSGVMEDLGILSLEMAMMDKGRPWPALSVCATSSHDMETLRMQYANANEGRDMPPEEVYNVLAAHFNSDSMLTINPIQDYLALDAAKRRKDFDSERINMPADSGHHWRYRIHLDIKALAGARKLNAAIRELVRNSGR
ncbi:MAG: 4-alpha-glucanotransferase [Bacteroidales bacterium]|nr:4-alpha-glucanotransferase [Bacteroidales bacterium]